MKLLEKLKDEIEYTEFEVIDDSKAKAYAETRNTCGENINLLV